MGRSVGMCGEKSGLRPPRPCAPSPAYLPNEAITLGGRRCLVWSGGKGHCDRDLATPMASSLRLSHLAVSCSVLTCLPFCPHPCTPFSSLFPSPLPSLSPSVCFWGSQSLQPSLPWLSVDSSSTSVLCRYHWSAPSPLAGP